MCTVAGTGAQAVESGSQSARNRVHPADELRASDRATRNVLACNSLETAPELQRPDDPAGGTQRGVRRASTVLTDSTIVEWIDSMPDRVRTVANHAILVEIFHNLRKHHCIAPLPHWLRRKGALEAFDTPTGTIHRGHRVAHETALHRSSAPTRSIQQGERSLRCLEWIAPAGRPYRSGGTTVSIRCFAWIAPFELLRGHDLPSR